MKKIFMFATIVSLGHSVEVEGYVRGAYQIHNVTNDKTYQDDALGGAIHAETDALKGVSLGLTGYTSNAIFLHDNQELVPLRGENHKSYSIVGEAYLKLKLDKNMVKIGRQKIETPFAQIDDIGMIPNSFEAITLENKSLKEARVLMGYITKMSGVDAPVVDSFTSLNGKRGVMFGGIEYEGFKDLTLNGWYYQMNQAQIDKIGYFQADYEKRFNTIGYEIGLQYVNEHYTNSHDANIYGASLSVSSETVGTSFNLSYNTINGNSAFSGFGGGIFYTNSEYLILDNGGENAKALHYGLEYNILNNLSVGLGKISLKNEQNTEVSETDLLVSYAPSEQMEFHLIASKLNAQGVGEDDAKHLRMFANYNF